jgi:hypothetical protein
MAKEPTGAPIPMTKKPTTPQGQWPTDPGEMLGYYRMILKQITGLETDLKALTGDPKLQWDGGQGQLKAMTRLKPADRERVMQAQSQVAALREEKTEIERMIPGIMKLRESQLSGMSPTQARATERKGLEGLAGAMTTASAPQAELPIGRQMLEAELGPMDDSMWEAYRSRQLGVPSSAVNPMDERAMALREQESQWQQQRYNQEMQMQREAQQRQMEQHRQSLMQQAFENQMAQRQFAATMAGDVAGMRQQAWAQGMPWAVPGGTQYTPNFGPGGLAQQIATGIGYDFAPQPVARWDAPDPRAIYQQMGALGNVPLPQFQQPQQPQYPAAPTPEQFQAFLPFITGGGRR